MGVDDGDAAFLSEGGDKGIVCEGVVRAVKKAGPLLSLPSSESPPAPVGVGGARGGGDVGCHKCGLPNDPSKKRCSSCQG
jgi:hypothetical protein